MISQKVMTYKNSNKKKEKKKKRCNGKFAYTQKQDIDSKFYNLQLVHHSLPPIIFFHYYYYFICRKNLSIISSAQTIQNRHSRDSMDSIIKEVHLIQLIYELAINKS